MVQQSSDELLTDALESNQDRMEQVINDLDNALEFDTHRLELFRSHLLQISEQIERALNIIDQNYRLTNDDYVVGASVTNVTNSLDATNPVMRRRKSKKDDGRVVEGVFDGEHMMAADGNRYMIPQNYASKSKLVEGDILKLVINEKGEFTFKQISPIERQRFSGKLCYDESCSYFFAESNDKRWKILPASVSYFKGEHDDEIIFLVPKNSMSSWAAVENIINSGLMPDFETIEQDDDIVESFSEQTSESLLKIDFYQGLEKVDAILK